MDQVRVPLLMPRVPGVKIRESIRRNPIHPVARKIVGVVVYMAVAFFQYENPAVYIPPSAFVMQSVVEPVETWCDYQCRYIPTLVMCVPSAKQKGSATPTRGKT